MKKKKYIKKIRKIVAREGEFCIAELDQTESIALTSLGDAGAEMVDKCSIGGVKTVIMINGAEEDGNEIPYEEIPKIVLSEILDAAREWDAICCKTAKRISS